MNCEICGGPREKGGPTVGSEGRREGKEEGEGVHKCVCVWLGGGEGEEEGAKGGGVQGLRKSWSCAPLPSTDKTVNRGAAVADRNACPTQSVPGRLDTTQWKRNTNCLLLLAILARKRFGNQNSSRSAGGEPTPPSRFLEAVCVDNINGEIMSPQCRPNTRAPSHWCILPVVVRCPTAKAIDEHRQAPHQVSKELKSMTSPRISLTCSLGLMFLQWKYSAVFATNTAPVSSYQTRNTCPAGHGLEQPSLVSLAHSSHRAHGSRVWTARCIRELTQRSMANCCAQFLAADRPCPATLVKSQTAEEATLRTPKNDAAAS